MHAPVDKHRVNEIVAEIVELVGCPEVEVYIRKLIADFGAAQSPFTGNRRENVEYAVDVSKLIIKLVRKLKGPRSMFLSDRFWSLGNTSGNIIIEFNPQTVGYISQESPRLKHLVKELDLISSRCNLIIRNQLGQHGSQKHLHAQAAAASYTILDEAANRAGTRLQLGCAPTSKFVKIARLFLKAGTGEYDVDLVQACRALKTKLDTKA
jgi:hypothetical protein